MDIDVRDTGPAPLIAALGRELGIVKAVNEIVKWDEKQCFIDPGTHTLAMIIDILLGRSPLYLVEKNYAEMDVELIFGKSFKSSDFNDDGSILITELSPQHIGAYKEKKLQGGRLYTGKGGLCGSTVNKLLTVLNQALKNAASPEKQIISVNPMRLVERKLDLC